MASAQTRTPEINIQLDLVEWEHARQKAIDMLVSELDMHMCHASQALNPVIGILTHHEIMADSDVYALRRVIELARDRGWQWISGAQALATACAVEL
jgi:hypothetical protein